MRETTADAAPGQTPARPDDTAVYRYLAFGETQRPFLIGGPAPAAAPTAPAADLESLRAAIRAHGGPLASTAAVRGADAAAQPAPTTQPRTAPVRVPRSLREARGTVRDLDAARRGLAARVADARERAAVPVEALLHASFVEAHAGERPAERAAARGRVEGLVDAVLPPARPADEDAAADVLLALREPAREVFASPSFAARPYVDAPTVRALFEDFLAHPRRHDPERFWRLLNLELWLRDAVDGEAAPAARPGAAEEAEPPRRREAGPRGQPRQGAGPRLRGGRPPLPTVPAADPSRGPGHRPHGVPAPRDRGLLPRPARGRHARGRPVALLRVREDRGHHPGPLLLHVGDPPGRRRARALPPGHPHPRRHRPGRPHHHAAGHPGGGPAAHRALGGRGRRRQVAGRRGVFYNVVGGNVRAIDGPTTYSAFPANVSAKLPPADPDGVAREVSAMIRAADIPEWARRSFAGTVVMDANDIGRNALGRDTAASAAVLEAAFADNPLGQGRERTPLAVVVRMD